MTDDTMTFLERSFGILNPLDTTDWLEIVVIFVAQISKRMDHMGSVCLRPSQAAILLFGLISKDSIECERKEKLVRLFLDNLQETHQFDQELAQLIDELLGRENKYLKYKNQFDLSQREFKKTLEKDISEVIRKEIEKQVKKASNLNKFLQDSIKDVQEYVDLLREFKEEARSIFFKKLLNFISNEKVRKMSDEEKSNFVFTQELEEELHESSLQIPFPQVEYDPNDHGNTFNQILNYILLQKHFLEHTQESTVVNEDEILIQEKALLDTKV